MNENPGLTTPLHYFSPVTGTRKPNAVRTATQPAKTYSKEATPLTRTYPQARKFQRQEGRAPFY